MKKFTLLVLTALLLCASCTAMQMENQPERVLFVGNSLTYVGSLPAVFSALATANSHPVKSDMIVRGGATLSQRVADGSITRALEQNQYTTLVLQERGGALMCSFGPDSCVRSREAIKTLVELARKNDLKVVLLGTYQGLQSASRRLVEAESAAAAEIGIPYIEVSETLGHLRSAAPELTWFYTDGMHPGKHLILLDAIQIYRQLFGVYPEANSFTVNAPIYTTNSGLTETLRAADAPPPKANTPKEISYSSETINKLLSIINNDDSS